MRHLWLLPAALLLGCAHGPSVTSERVVQLPPESRQQIIEAQRSIDIADQNLVAGRVAVDEAKRFRDIADRELDAAKAHADAAARAMDLGASSNAQRTYRAGREGRESAVREVFAARAKLDYADRLIDLRKAELEQRRAERDLARADFEYLKYSHLRANNMGGDLNERDFIAARDNAQTNVASARTKVASLYGNVEALRTAWLQRSQEAKTASRGLDIPPPPPPRPLDNPRTFTPPPAGAPNEGPSAPQSIPQY